MASFISNKQQDEKGVFDILYTSVNFMPEQKCVKIEGVKRYYDADNQVFHREAFSRVDRNEPKEESKRFIYDGKEHEQYQTDDLTQDIIEPDEVIKVVVKEANPRYDNWCQSFESTLKEKL